MNGGSNGDERNLANSAQKMVIPTTSAELCVSGVCGGTDRVGIDGADYDREVKLLSRAAWEKRSRHAAPVQRALTGVNIAVESGPVFLGHPGTKITDKPRLS